MTRISDRRRARIDRVYQPPVESMSTLVTLEENLWGSSVAFQRTADSIRQIILTTSTVWMNVQKNKGPSPFPATIGPITFPPPTLNPTTPLPPPSPASKAYHLTLSSSLPHPFHTLSSESTPALPPFSPPTSWLFPSPYLSSTLPPRTFPLSPPLPYHLVFFLPPSLTLPPSTFPPSLPPLPYHLVLSLPPSPTLPPSTFPPSLPYLTT